MGGEAATVNALHKLPKYGNHTDHDELQDLRPNEKPTVVAASSFTTWPEPWPGTSASLRRNRPTHVYTKVHKIIFLVVCCKKFREITAWIYICMYIFFMRVYIIQIHYFGCDLAF